MGDGRAGGRRFEPDSCSSRPGSTRTSTIRSPDMELTADGFRELARRATQLAPRVAAVVLEGGYNLRTLPALVDAALEGFDSSTREAPPRRGFSVSRPVSRILSRVTIPLGSYPGPRRAASAGPVRLAPDGVWLAAASPRRWWALTPPFHPYRRRLRRGAGGGLLSVPLSVGFRRLACASVLPCGVRTFLERRRSGAPAVTRPATTILARHPASASSSPSWLPHSGQNTTPPRACMTNSPQTRHSSDAPRSSATSSWSSVRCSDGDGHLTAPGRPRRRGRGSGRGRA